MGERQARSTATALLDEVGVTALPVDPFAIAKMKRINVVERELPRDIYGACGYLDGAFHIVISSLCPTPGHRRFTAAHELGHYHLPKHVERMFSGGVKLVASTGAHFQDGASDVEREADHFASELLMPERLIKPFLRGRPSLAVTRAVAAACDVSLTSAAITMARLTGDPVIVLMSHRGNVEWPSIGSALRPYPWARVKMKSEQAPRGSCTRRLAENPDAILDGKEMERESLLCEWLPGAPSWVTVQEEAVGLGAYGRVLTILRPKRLPDPDEEQEREWREMRDSRREE